MDTSEYAAGLARADRKTFERFYDEYSPRLYHYILGRLRNRSDSEDVLQTVMMRLVRNRFKLKHVENLAAFVFTIARNESIRFAKRSKRRMERGDIYLVEPPDESDSHPEVLERCELVNDALKQLPLDQYEALTLKIYSGLTFRQIGAVTGVSENTAASRYRYAVEKVRTYLGEEDEKGKNRKAPGRIQAG